MAHFEDPYISFSREELPQQLEDTELWKYLNSLQAPREEIQRLQGEIVEAVAGSLERASQLPANQAGRTEDLAGKHNFVLHKFCWGALKLTYSVITQVLKAKAGDSSVNPKEAGGLLKAAWEVYGSVETPNTDEWAIIEAVETFNFRLGHNILREPGPTIKDIEKELAKKGLLYDDLATKLLDMEKRTILSKIPVDGKTYYQIRYLSEWITGGS